MAYAQTTPCNAADLCRLNFLKLCSTSLVNPYLHLPVAQIRLSCTVIKINGILQPGSISCTVSEYLWEYICPLTCFAQVWWMLVSHLSYKTHSCKIHLRFIDLKCYWLIAISLYNYQWSNWYCTLVHYIVKFVVRQSNYLWWLLGFWREARKKNKLCNISGTFLV